GGTDISSLVAAAAEQGVRPLLTGLTVLGLVFGVTGWALSILASAVRFFDFTLRSAGEELRVSYGLFTRREQ
ncbi:MAG: hypothetical protein GWN85_14550, partial [Gemmatimonadetes bacterium]|nr:hypothetical protein [Gemmatimonadota bacterium]NIS36807.1 hypothetical protein [Actinomycetota bacterium]NIU71295.1 hypothetical protein [Actinomycetota bacterium]NIW33243.1 hypothetical protein [Actinomycetota bacterium]NIX25370.1 hypothetical protein [Actinomycetota bacterium]